ncbi:hypothetical protein A2187_02020 [Candidatus Collierbacteria bacterium RIFOXYA1_FULL_46_24]|nr:MAG: hypothetical protein A2187_02020 [Candidatus Collierbacteria bacterium RIFOXYA1_FULL_46_24]
MSQVLTTGATGLVGSRFVDLYAKRFPTSNMDLTTGVNITDRDSIEKFVTANPADILIHLAAFTDTNKAFAESGNQKGLCYQVNVVGTRNIAAVCEAHGIHLIHVSTDFVFDGQKSAPYIETDPVSPLEWYGETKALAEKVVQDSGVHSTILRIAYPYRANYALKPDIIGKIKTGLETGKLYPQFVDTVITPTFIDDIAAAFAKIIELKPSGIFHIVGSDALSPYELAQKVAVAYGFDPSLVQKGSLTEYLKTASRPFARHVAMSNAKATKQLGLTFAGIDQGLAELKKQQSL